MSIQVRRLTPADLTVARELFGLMSAAFGETQQPLSNDWLTEHLGSPRFWALAAFAGPDLVGGLTAHGMPLTRAEITEVFVYDIAVRATCRRRGIGRALLTTLRELCADDGIQTVLVPADADDGRAVEFYRALGGASSPVTFFVFGGD